MLLFRGANEPTAVSQPSNRAGAGIYAETLIQVKRTLRKWLTSGNVCARLPTTEAGAADALSQCPAAELRARHCGAAKKTLASAQPAPKNRYEAGVLPGVRDCSRALGRLRTDPLNLAGPVPVKGVRHHRAKEFIVRSTEDCRHWRRRHWPGHSLAAGPGRLPRRGLRSGRSRARRELGRGGNAGGGD